MTGIHETPSRSTNSRIGMHEPELWQVPLEESVEYYQNISEKTSQGLGKHQRKQSLRTVQAKYSACSCQLAEEAYILEALSIQLGVSSRMGQDPS